MTRSLYPLASAILALAACGRKETPAPQTDAADTAAQSFTSNRVTVAVRGSGRDMILIPGLGSHSNVWDSIVGPLEPKYRLHVVQVHGFAGTPPGGNANGPVSAPVAEELTRYITVNRLTKPAVVGHSMGGTIAMMIAARNPDLVGHVVVVDMHPVLAQFFGGPSATPESVRPMADRIMVQQDSFVTAFGQMVNTMTNRESLRAGLVQNVNRSDKGTVVNSFAELMTLDLRPELSRITAPLAVIYVVPPQAGMRPAQFDAAMKQAYANAPNAKLVRIDNALHFIQLDQPARLVQEIEAFVPAQ